MQSFAGLGVLIDTLFLLDRFLLCATVMTSRFIVYHLVGGCYRRFLYSFSTSVLTLLAVA